MDLRKMAGATWSRGGAECWTKAPSCGPEPYRPLSTNAAVSDLTIEIRFPSAMFASSRCRPHSGVGLGCGVLAPRTALISSTFALFAEEQCAR